jgi:hypothetical protein
MGSWEFLAFVGLWIGAAILALDTGLKQAPNLRRFVAFTEAPLWGFAPFILLTLSGLIFLARAINPGDGIPTNAVASPPITQTKVKVLTLRLFGMKWRLPPARLNRS